MKILKLVTVIMLFIGQDVFSMPEKPKILTTIPPLASLVKMIVGNMAEVKFVQSSSMCPDHHTIKPSEIFDLNNADYIIYVSNKFETYLKKPLSGSKAEKLKIASIDGVKILDNNYHIWVDLDNVENILKGIKLFFASKGFDEKILEQNYLYAIKKLEPIKRRKTIANSVIIGDSLRYIYNSEDSNIRYYPRIGSLKNFNEIEKYIKENKVKCIIFDHENRAESFARKGLDLLELNIEHWESEIKDLDGYFIKYIKNIHHKLYECK